MVAQKEALLRERLALEEENRNRSRGQTAQDILKLSLQIESLETELKNKERVRGETINGTSIMVHALMEGHYYYTHIT